MTQLGTVIELWRYPVKSFQGEQVDELELAPGGAVGDRRLAVVDSAAGKVLSGKRYAELLEASARLVDDAVIVTLPGGATWEASDPGVHKALSAWLGHEVELRPPPPDVVLPMEMHTGMSDDTTPIFDWPGPIGTWNDLADAHWLTTASLASIAALHPAGTWDVRRFRPTALIEAAEDGWPEDAWTTISIGSVESSIFMPTPRCTMPSRAQPGFAEDRTIGTTIRDQHDNNLGVYAGITAPGTARVGDSVHAS